MHEFGRGNASGWEVFGRMSLAGMVTEQSDVASDVELVNAARAQDDDAFEELYRRYHDPVAGYVWRFVRDHGRAEDVTQEAFVAALRGIRQTEREIQFKPWIYEIARNAAIDSHRRASRAEEVSFDADGALATADRLRLRASPAAEVAAIDRERFDHLRGALDELSDTQHRIIVMRELEGLSYREIGVRMQLSSAAVESSLFRARRKLESEYQQLDTGRRCARIRALMARLAEGVESRSDRRRLDRHARHCWACRRSARQLGLGRVGEGLAPRRAVALLPLPAFLRRFGLGDATGAAGARDATAGLVGTPAMETLAQGAQKAAVVIASAIAVGGGGATLGGVGPLAIDSGSTPAHQAEGAREAGSASTAGRDALRQAPPGARSEGPRGEHTGSRGTGSGGTPSPGDRPEGGRQFSSQPDSPASPVRPAGPGLPDLPGLTPPEHQRPGGPISDARTPTLPGVSKPALPQLPRLPGAPAVPYLPAGAAPEGDQLGALVPGVTGVSIQKEGGAPPR